MKAAGCLAAWFHYEYLPDALNMEWCYLRHMNDEATQQALREKGIIL